jgi:uncharacterized protein YrrD
VLRSARDVKHYRIYASDDEVGKMSDLYFDDQRWTIRYLVVDTGGWLSGRTVLISPHAVTEIDDDALRINLSLTQQQVQKAPGVETALPVTREYEIEYNRYYGWPDYWAGGGLWGVGVFPAGYMPVTGPVTGTPDANTSAAAPSGRPVEPTQATSIESTNHLRSVNEVTGYTILAKDGKLGRVEDFLFEHGDWSIQDLVVDTSFWLGGEVLLALNVVEGVDWTKRHVTVNVDRDYVRNSPPVDMARFRHRT